MVTSRKIHAPTNSNPAPKNSNPSREFRFSAKKLLVANAVLIVGVTGVLDMHGCLQKQKEQAKEPASLSSQDSFTVTKSERVSVYHSLKTLPPGTSKSVASVVNAGRKTLEGNKLLITQDKYELLIDHFIGLYGQAGGDMVDAVLAQVKNLPEPERDSFLDDAYLAVTALLLRPYAAWEGPVVLKNLDQLISSPEFNQESLDNFAGDNNLMREYFELTMNIGNQLYF